jgi:hypothetical protein
MIQTYLQVDRAYPARAKHDLLHTQSNITRQTTGTCNAHAQHMYMYHP